MAKRGKVLVTGGAGYIALHIVRQCLDEGWAVRASGRSEQAEQAIARATGVVAGDPRLSFVRLDLEQPEGWDAAMAGVDALIHTASPFPSVQPRDRDELSRTAVDGTLNALRAAARAGVGRVVLTSSVAAIMYRQPPESRAFYDERDWSDPDSPLCNAYSRSKTLAEKAAWTFVGQEAKGMQLTTINPGFVLGPGLDRRIGTSLATLSRFLKGSDPLVPKVGYPVVDVRDVAALHVTALSTPASVGERFAAAGRFMGFPEMATILKAAYPGRRITTRTAPDFAVRLLSRFDRSIATILPDLGRKPEVSAEKAKRTFGMSFRPVEQAVLDGAEWLIRERLA